MAFIVETGAGTPGANAGCTIAFVTAYLTDRARETENSWSTSSTARQQQAVVAGTDYIEKRWRSRFKGSLARLQILGRTASGTVEHASNPLDTETTTVGLVTYRFVAALAQENDVLIGATTAESVENLVAAINGGEGSGTKYHAKTRHNFEVTGYVDEDEPTTLGLLADNIGESGNAIALSTTVTGATASSATLTSGIDTAAQPLSFPRVGLYTPNGELVVGVPLRYKQAVAEYAVRSLDAALAPDPEMDGSLVGLSMKRDKVGPIEEERRYVEGAVPRVFKPYPAADELLADYVTSAGGTYR